MSVEQFRDHLKPTEPNGQGLCRCYVDDASLSVLPAVKSLNKKYLLSEKGSAVPNPCLLS